MRIYIQREIGTTFIKPTKLCKKYPAKEPVKRNTHISFRYIFPRNKDTRCGLRAECASAPPPPAQRPTWKTINFTLCQKTSYRFLVASSFDVIDRRSNLKY